MDNTVKYVDTYGKEIKMSYSHISTPTTTTTTTTTTDMASKAYVDNTAFHQSVPVSIIKALHTVPSVVPIGTISQIPMSDSRLDLPSTYDGYIKCEGQSVSATEYPDLYKAVRGAFGTPAGIASSTINPNIKGYNGTDGGSITIGLGPALFNIPDMVGTHPGLGSHTHSTGSHSHIISSHTHAIGSTAYVQNTVSP